MRSSPGSVSNLQGQEELTSSTSGHPHLGPLRQKILQKHSAVPANTYVESVVGQARPWQRVPVRYGFDFLAPTWRCLLVRLATRSDNARVKLPALPRRGFAPRPSSARGHAHRSLPTRLPASPPPPPLPPLP